jgi:hypothetical protein
MDLVDTVSIVLAVAGIVIGAAVSYNFYRKSRRVRQPVWAMRTVNLVSDWAERMPGLGITYVGSTVRRLSVSKIVFWNMGADSIRRADVAVADPLRIQAAIGVEILSAQVLGTNNEASRVVLEQVPDRGAASIGFDFLDGGHGAVFSIVHSGDGERGVTVQGTIIGAGKPRRVDVQGSGDTVATAPDWPRRPEPSTSSKRGKARLSAWILGNMALFITIGVLMGLGGFTSVSSFFAGIGCANLVVSTIQIVSARLRPSVPRELQQAFLRDV